MKAQTVTIVGMGRIGIAIARALRASAAGLTIVGHDRYRELVQKAKDEWGAIDKAEWPEVVECSTVTGAVDYMLRIVTRDMHAYDDFLRDKMLALGLVSDVQSRIVMRVTKRTTAAPLELVSEHLKA